MTDLAYLTGSSGMPVTCSEQRTYVLIKAVVMTFLYSLEALNSKSAIRGLCYETAQLDICVEVQVSQFQYSQVSAPDTNSKSDFLPSVQA